jgi:predicted lipoprotein with Yx(FWY)xxD motif
MRAGWISAAVLALAFAATGAIAAAGGMPAGVKVENGMLVDAKGMVLYTFDNDKEAGKSACAGNCLVNWPALMANADSRNMGEWTVITRDDGSKQWAYKGKPLYTYKNDTKAGEVTGDNRGMVWHIAKP